MGVYDLGSVQKIPSEVGPLGKLRSPTAALANALERTEQKMWKGIISNKRILKSEAFGSFGSLALRIMCQQSMLDMLSSHAVL